MKINEANAKKVYYSDTFIPVKNISDGIIETSDNRYLKIMEIEPVNYLLRSAHEQNSIIATFASWLKISPVKMQFKSVTRKADSEKYIKSLQRDLMSVTDKECSELAKEYINLIRNVGKREALTRKFLLIFEYEQMKNYRGANTRENIIATLNNVYSTAKTYFHQCGNKVVEPQNEDLFLGEILYCFFNKRSSQEEPFSARMNRVVNDVFIERDLDITKDSVPEMPIAALVSPRGIDLTHFNYIIMDGLYYTFLYITSDGYKGAVYGGWMSPFINAGEGIDIDLFLRREDRATTLEKVGRRIRWNQSKMKNMQSTYSDFDEVSNAIASGYYIKNAISQLQEDLYYMSTIFTVTATTYEGLQVRRNMLIDGLRAMDYSVRDCKFKQEAALKTIMPLNKMDKNLYELSKRNVTTSGAASTYLFTSFEMSDDGGILLGVNQQNNSLCIVDLFDSSKYKNANSTILGTTGAGKTFLMQLMALRMRMRNIQSFIIAPLKGHEFKRAAKQIGGEYVKIAPGSSHSINIMEIREITSPDTDLIDEVEENEDSYLARKIQTLHIFFALLIPDISNIESNILDEALVATYAAKGIVYDNNSLYTDETHTKMKEMPVLGDLQNQLIEMGGAAAENLITILNRFVSGSAQSFNKQTNVDLTNKYIVLDISTLKGTLLPVGMFIALDYVWDAAQSDRTKKKAIFIDETWHLIGASSNALAANFVLEIFKIIRGYGGAAIAATQDINDFFSLEDGKYGKGIINNSNTKMILKLEPDEATRVQEIFKLTDLETEKIERFERGEAILTTGNNKITVHVKSSVAEEEIITTDREQLAAIAQRKRMRQASKERAQ